MWGFVKHFITFQSKFDIFNKMQAQILDSIIGLAKQNFRA